jgi:hypothetical protein
MRRLALVACALGLLLALPGSASASEVIDVPATAVFRAGNNGTNNCTAFVFIQWPEQEKAQAWRLEREYLKGTANIFTHDEKNLAPPFSDEPTGAGGWVPPAGHHWYLHTFRSKSDASGDPVECASLQAEMLGRVISATVHVTVPDMPEEEEKEEEEKEEEKRKEEEKSIPPSPNVPEGPPGKKGKATCRGKTPTIFAEPGPPTNGTARRDVIVGTPKRDIIRAHGGNDLVCGLGGNDLILGGRGQDVLLGQQGKDTIRGQEDKDVLLGGGGADRLFGHAAADRLFGQAGADALNGGSGRPDLCNGGSGRDQRSSPGCERRRNIP